MSYYRRDDWVTNGLGQAIANATVTYYLQPGLTLATVYSDSTGTPAANPQQSDGLGHAVVYMANSLYTITYSGLQIQTLTLPDQTPNFDSGGGGGSVTPVTPTPSPNGIITAFTLPYTPAFPTNGLLFVSGSYVPYGAGTYTISGAVITFHGTPPQNGDVIIYFGS